MTGVQTLVPLMLDHVNAGRLSITRFVDLTSAGPARLFNIACKGRIAAGYDADFTLVDLKRSETITNKCVASRAGWTPYDGMRVTGWPVGTFLRGRRVMWQGELVASATGEPVRFLGTLKAEGHFFVIALNRHSNDGGVISSASASKTLRFGPGPERPPRVFPPPLRPRSR